jgi:hypothetical protein
MAVASGVFNKENLVQKEMCRRCGIVMARTAMSMISPGPEVRPWARYSLLPRARLSRSRIQSILRVGGGRGRLVLVPSRTGFTRGPSGWAPFGDRLLDIGGATRTRHGRTSVDDGGPGELNKPVVLVLLVQIESKIDHTVSSRGISWR